MPVAVCVAPLGTAHDARRFGREVKVESTQDLRIGCQPAFKMAFLNVNEFSLKTL